MELLLRFGQLLLVPSRLVFESPQTRSFPPLVVETACVRTKTKPCCFAIPYSGTMLSNGDQAI